MDLFAVNSFIMHNYIKFKFIIVGLFFGFSSIIMFSQNICNEFEIINLDFELETEWGNLLGFDVEIPDTSIYAPYFFLNTEDDYIQITDSIASYFWITGPIIVDLLYHFEYDSIPEDHLFSGNILMISGDDVLSCDMPFEFIVNSTPIIGDVNEDGLLNILDINLIVSIILGISESNDIEDINEDGLVNVIDVLLILYIILGS